MAVGRDDTTLMQCEGQDRVAEFVQRDRRYIPCTGGSLPQHSSVGRSVSQIIYILELTSVGGDS